MQSPLRRFVAMAPIVRIARRLTVACLATIAYSLSPTVVRAQRVPLDSVRVNDSTLVYAITLADGAKLVGRIVALSADSVQVRGAAAVTMVARSAVREVRAYPVSAMHNGDLWFENPHATRLLFSPTAIALRKGDSYFADFWLFVFSAATGVTDRFTLGVGMTLVPGIRFDQNLFYALPKYTVLERSRFHLAVGALAATVPWENDTHKSLGLLYGVSTWGSRESNVTLGTGFGYVGNRLADRPVVTLGGQVRVTKRVALISENWFAWSGGEHGGFLTYGVRLLGEKMAVDLAFGSSTSFGDASNVPLLGFATKF